MKRFIIYILLLCAYTVGLATYVNAMAYEPNESTQQAGYELTEMQRWRLHLYEQVLAQGLSYYDFVLLADKTQGIIRCESGFRQYASDGSVIISEGNIGLFQVNKLAHEKTYTKMGLDMSDPYDNLTFGFFLYERDGISAWYTWSGHCWGGLYQKIKHKLTK